MELNSLQYVQSGQASEILQFIIQSGIINFDDVQNNMEAMKRKELLDKHLYKIWQGKDGKWYTYLPDKEKGRILKKKSTREAVEKDVITYWKSELENPTITEVFNEWNDRRLELRKISSATHLRNKQLYNRHYEEFGKHRIKNITSREVCDFLEEQIPKFKLSAKGFSNLKTLTRGFLKRAKRLELIDFRIDEILAEIDYSEIEFNKNRKSESLQVFTDSEMDRIFEYTRYNMDIENLGIMLMFVTGMRVGELVTLKWGDVGNGGSYVSIRRTETRYRDKESGKLTYSVKESPKTEAGIRDVVIPKDYLWVLARMKRINPFTEFIFEKNGERLHTEQIRKRLYRICRNVDIKQRGTHAIRKTYGSILLDNNIDQKLIIGQMGHTDIATTETFYHKNRRTNEEKSDILSEIPQLKVL